MWEILHELYRVLDDAWALLLWGISANINDKMMIMLKELECDNGLSSFCRGHATYKSPCRSVRPSVGPSVCHTLLFLHFWAFWGLESLFLSRPLPKSWLPLSKSLLPLPKSLLPLSKSLLPLPNARDRSSRVYGFVFCTKENTVKTHLLILSVDIHVEWRIEVRWSQNSRIHNMDRRIYRGKEGN